MRLFLDIDGVVLGKDDPQSSSVRLARSAEALLRLAIDRFDPWWLTTHSDGTIVPIVRHLAPYCPPDVLDLVQRIWPERFKTLKTEAFADIGSDFRWLDDAPVANNWIEVDTRRCPDDLARVLTLLGARR